MYEEQKQNIESIYEEQNIEKENRTWFKLLLLILCICTFIGIVAVFAMKSFKPVGYKNYTVQMEQYYVEYSDEYDYWDVLTVEYPRLEEGDIELQEQLNGVLYDVAMDRVKYWHFSPDEEVQAFQKEIFSIFCSDVKCYIPFHSQYLLCVDYRELYSAGNPVWYTSITERGLNLDLITGVIYELDDIITIDEEFMKIWCDAAHEKYGDIFAGDEEEAELFLSWFLNEDEEVKAGYQLHNFFYPTEDGSFIIGLAYDPKPVSIHAAKPREVIYIAELEASELTPFRTESEFWEKYDKSEEAGQILECEDLHTNLWLGDDAGVWNYWDNLQGG